MKKKNIAMLVSVVLLLGAAIGGTLAWLTATATDVVNTFTPSNISITLEETKPEGKTAKMIPGATIEKDPKVTVKKDSVACWLFIKVEEENNKLTSDTSLPYLSYTVDTTDAWTAVPDHEGYYYRVVNESTADVSFNILTGNTVTVNGEATNDDMNALISSGKNPTLTFKAAAVQKVGFDTVAAAWDELPDGFTAP